MKKFTSSQKVTWITNIATILFIIPLLYLVHYIRNTYNIPLYIGLICIIPIIWGFANLLSKWLGKSEWKDTIDEMEKEGEKKKKDEVKARLNIVMMLGYIYSFGYFLNIYSHLYRPDSNIYTLTNNIGQGICLLICTVFISIIYYNTKHKRIFIQANANLIKGIGIVVTFADLLTNCIIVEILPDYSKYTSNNHDSMVIGLFIIAIGYVFQEAIKMKEEQDLTI